MKQFFKSLSDVINNAAELSRTGKDIEVIIAQHLSGDYYMTTKESEIGSNDSIIEVYYNGNPVIYPNS